MAALLADRQLREQEEERQRANLAAQVRRDCGRQLLLLLTAPCAADSAAAELHWSSCCCCCCCCHHQAEALAKQVRQLEDALRTTTKEYIAGDSRAGDVARLETVRIV